MLLQPGIKWWLYHPPLILSNLILVTSSKDKRENVTRIKNGIMPSSLTLILVTIRFGASLRLSLLQLDLGPPLLVSV